MGFIYSSISFQGFLAQQVYPSLCKCYLMLLSSRAWRLTPHLDGVPVERGHLEASCPVPRFPHGGMSPRDLLFTVPRTEIIYIDGYQNASGYQGGGSCWNITS